MYVLGGGGVGGVAALIVVFEEGEVSGLVEEDDDRSSVVEVVVVVVFFLPSPSLLLVSFLVVLLDCIGTTEGFGRVLSPVLCFGKYPFLPICQEVDWGDMSRPYFEDTIRNILTKF